MSSGAYNPVSIFGGAFADGVPCIVRAFGSASEASVACSVSKPGTPVHHAAVQLPKSGREHSSTSSGSIDAAMLAALALSEADAPPSRTLGPAALAEDFTFPLRSAYLPTVTLPLWTQASTTAAVAAAAAATGMGAGLADGGRALPAAGMVVGGLVSGVPATNVGVGGGSSAAVPAAGMAGSATGGGSVPLGATGGVSLAAAALGSPGLTVMAGGLAAAASPPPSSLSSSGTGFASRYACARIGGLLVDPIVPMGALWDWWRALHAPCAVSDFGSSIAPPSPSLMMVNEDEAARTSPAAVLSLSTVDDARRASIASAASSNGAATLPDAASGARSVAAAEPLCIDLYPCAAADPCAIPFTSDVSSALVSAPANVNAVRLAVARQARAQYFQDLKQSLFLRFGDTHRLLNLSAKEQDDLYDAVAAGDVQAMSATFAKVSPVSTSATGANARGCVRVLVPNPSASAVAPAFIVLQARLPQPAVDVVPVPMLLRTELGDVLSISSPAAAATSARTAGAPSPAPAAVPASMGTAAVPTLTSALAAALGQPEAALYGVACMHGWVLRVPTQTNDIPAQSAYECLAHPDGFLYLSFRPTPRAV